MVGSETIGVAFEAIRANDMSAARLRKYEERINAGDVRRELYGVRNVHQAFGKGLIPGVLSAGVGMVTGGWWYKDPMPAHAGFERMQTMEVLDEGFTPRPLPVEPFDPPLIEFLGA